MNFYEKDLFFFKYNKKFLKFFMVNKQLNLKLVNKFNLSNNFINLLIFIQLKYCHFQFIFYRHVYKYKSKKKNIVLFKFIKPFSKIIT